MEKVLIVDDDEELCELVSEYLTVEGFDVDSVNDGEEGLRHAREELHDLIILDVMMPKKNGFDVLRELRQTSTIPVVMLTARGEDMERIVGLEIGADDYLPKPFNPRELVARIRAVLRRIEKAGDDEDQAERLRSGELEMNTSARSAKMKGKDLGLTAVEYDILAELLRNAGQVVKKEDLSVRVLERELSPFDRSLDMHISNIRKKLGEHKGGKDRIKTIRSVGYIFTTEAN
ncbi:MAG: DNA-binding response regulator [Acidobacteria bacterium]|nr:MAG: DNA-binding response regulator [Acidobacteriota bacterium]REK01748.1 MAG: DNA-binding response regulator [Acidobacteriota bacterium]REK14704.1 MAG: DNA-binding response regulator [Acidobacteriota bacterium]REK45419.1 MAG: DNA-binding response regulator [Acidobacteriota bacterium]